MSQSTYKGFNSCEKSLTYNKRALSQSPYKGFNRKIIHYLIILSPVSIPYKGFNRKGVSMNKMTEMNESQSPYKGFNSGKSLI